MGFPRLLAAKKVPKSDGIESNPHEGIILIPFLAASS